LNSAPACRSPALTRGQAVYDTAACGLALSWRSLAGRNPAWQEERSGQAEEAGDPRTIRAYAYEGLPMVTVATSTVPAIVVPKAEY
jgi:hypothetical protein